MIMTSVGSDTDQQVRRRQKVWNKNFHGLDVTKCQYGNSMGRGEEALLEPAAPIYLLSKFLSLGLLFSAPMCSGVWLPSMQVVFLCSLMQRELSNGTHVSLCRDTSQDSTFQATLRTSSHFCDWSIWLLVGSPVLAYCTVLTVRPSVIPHANILPGSQTPRVDDCARPVAAEFENHQMFRASCLAASLAL